jgi:ribosomal protein S18 acetylase RimI-like enzyme
MPEIEIRPAEITDFNSLVQIDHSYPTPYVWQMDRFIEKGAINLHFRETRLPRPVRVDYPNPPDKLASDFSQKGGVLVAVLEGIQVGYIQIKENPSTSTAWVHNLAVIEELRRKGIGSALILAGQNWAGQRNLRRMVIEMQSKNYPAIQLANKLGYEFSGYNDHYYENRDIALFFACFLR